MIVEPNPGEFITSPWGQSVAKAINLPPGLAIESNPPAQQFSSQIGTLAKLTMGGGMVRYNQGGYWDDANDGFTVPAGHAGLHRIDWFIAFEANTTGGRRGIFRLNAVNLQEAAWSPGIVYVSGAGGTVVREMADGDLGQLYCAHNSGVTMGLDYFSFSIMRLGENG